MDRNTLNRVRDGVTTLIRKSGVAVTAEEMARLQIVDFGLGRVEDEGVQTIDIVSTAGLRIKVMVMLPSQSLPQHLHPPYGDHPGKEETIRVVCGVLRVYLPGEDTMTAGFLPKGKEGYYTLRQEKVLAPTDQVTIDPGVEHWFQAGPEGAVTYSFYTQADDGHNRWADPAVKGVVGYSRP